MTLPLIPCPPILLHLNPFSGAFSVVVKAVHKDSGEAYAVKIVDKNSTGRKEMYDEINVMSMLSHANIVNFKEIFDRKDGYYVVLE